MAPTRRLAALLALIGPQAARACTSIAVGREASASGYAIVTHSDDSGDHTTDVRLVRVPRKKWPPNSRRPLFYWSPGYPRVVSQERAPDYAPVDGQRETVPIGSIPQVSETWGYWDTDYGIQNERGLSIGESTCTAKTVGWPAMPGKPYGYNRAGIEDLSKIALERCETARCAVETMGPIAVEQGFYSADSGEPGNPAYSGSSECLSIADAVAGEVWIFHVLTGRGNASAIWAAQRVPSDHIAPLANAFSIRKMNLKDPDNFLYSPGLTDLAQEQGWWSPADEATPDTFDFFGAYGFLPPDGYSPRNTKTILQFYSGRRMWRIWNLLSPKEGAKLDAQTGHLPDTQNPYPFSVRAPKGSVTLQMVMDAHRDHYEGTPYDLTQGMAGGPHGTPNRYKATAGVIGQWERAISMYRTTFSHVVEAKPSGRGIVWFGYDAAHGTAYLPFYGAADDRAPEAWRTGCQSKFSRKVAWWAFQLVNQYSDLNFRLINAEVQAKAHKIEEEGRRSVAEWEEAAAAMPEADARAWLTKKSNTLAEATLAQWWELLEGMFGKYSRYVVTWNETENGGEDALGQAYPEWWLSSPDVGFPAWTKDGPFHGTPDQAGGPSSNPKLGFGLVASATLLSWVVVAGAAYTLGARGSRGRQCVADGYVAQP